MFAYPLLLCAECVGAATWCWGGPPTEEGMSALHDCQCMITPPPPFASCEREMVLWQKLSTAHPGKGGGGLSKQAPRWTCPGKRIQRAVLHGRDLGHPLKCDACCALRRTARSSALRIGQRMPHPQPCKCNGRGSDFHC